MKLSLLRPRNSRIQFINGIPNTILILLPFYLQDPIDGKLAIIQLSLNLTVLLPTSPSDQLAGIFLQQVTFFFLIDV